MFLTIPSLTSTAEEKFINKGEAPGDASLLDLDAKNTVFYVGRVPPDFKVRATMVLCIVSVNARSFSRLI